MTLMSKHTARKRNQWLIALAFILAFAIGMYAPLWDAMPWNH